MREREAVRACMREISERIAGLEARLASLSNQRESRLVLRGRVALRGHLSGTPARPWPPASKQTLPVKSTSRETRPENCTF